MAPKIRTIMRELDDLLSKGEIEKLTSVATSAIKAFDKDRQYDNSIKTLIKLQSHLTDSSNQVILGDILSHLQIRYILTGQIDKAKEIKDNGSLEILSPLFELSNSLLESYIENSKAELQIQSIEKMSMFGSYATLPDLPVLHFDEDQDAVQILEDLFPNGRYIINLIQTENMLHHSIKVDVGTSQDVNIVENRRIFKIK